MLLNIDKFSFHHPNPRIQHYFALLHLILMNFKLHRKLSHNNEGKKLYIKTKALKCRYVELVIFRGKNPIKCSANRVLALCAVYTLLFFFLSREDKTCLFSERKCNISNHKWMNFVRTKKCATKCKWKREGESERGRELDQHSHINKNIKRDKGNAMTTERTSDMHSHHYAPEKNVNDTDQWVINSCNRGKIWEICAGGFQLLSSLPLWMLSIYNILWLCT